MHAFPSVPEVSRLPSCARRFDRARRCSERAKNCLTMSSLASPPSVARVCHNFSTDLVALKRCEVREVGVKYP